MSDEALGDAECVSALMDGELQGAEFVHAIDHLQTCASAREAWDTYHLVGEVLRTGKLATPLHDDLFMTRIRAQLAVTSMDVEIAGQDLPASEAVNLTRQPAANDGWWRLVVGLASVAFAGVLIWQAQGWISSGNSPTDAAVLAKLPAQPVVAASAVPFAVSDEETLVMLRDPQLDALLAAHRQHGGVTALQTPAGFLRNATFNEASR